MRQIYYFSIQSCPRILFPEALFASFFLNRKMKLVLLFWLGICKSRLMQILSFIVSVLLWISPPTLEANSHNSIDPIVSAIGSGSSSELARFFDSSISMNVNGQQGEYSKSQAEIVLKDFFKKNPSQGFSIVFQNENPGSLSTYIGEYSSHQNKFKVFIKVSQNSNIFRIYSLDFVKS